MNSPLIIADQNMPFVDAYFGHLGEVKLMAGRDIDRQAIKGAEILLVRSVTKVNSDLLQGSAVRFVGSATAGTDHIDLEYLEKNNIQIDYLGIFDKKNLKKVKNFEEGALIAVAAKIGKVRLIDNIILDKSMN